MILFMRSIILGDSTHVLIFLSKFKEVVNVFYVETMNLLFTDI